MFFTMNAYMLFSFGPLALTNFREFRNCVRGPRVKPANSAEKDAQEEAEEKQPLDVITI